MCDQTQVQCDTGCTSGEVDRSLAGAVNDGVRAELRGGIEVVGTSPAATGKSVVERVAGQLVVSKSADDILDAGGGRERQFQVRIDDLLCDQTQVQCDTGCTSGEVDRSLAGAVNDGVRAELRGGIEVVGIRSAAAGKGVVERVAGEFVVPQSTDDILN